MLVFCSCCDGFSKVQCEAIKRANLESVVGATPTLPPQGELLISGAVVVSIDDTIGALDRGDVHIRNGQIVAVGKDLQVPGVRKIDASGMILMPGFVDTHMHLWNGIFRGLVSYYSPQLAYFPMKHLLGPL